MRHDAAAMLNIDKEAYADLKANFSFTIDNISRMQPAELNTELFDKVYGEGVVKNEKEFRVKLRQRQSRCLLRCRS